MDVKHCKPRDYSLTTLNHPCFEVAKPGVTEEKRCPNAKTRESQEGPCAMKSDLLLIIA
jgi:hypothetical protein